MPEIRVYSRRGCHLCEVLIEELLPLVRGTFRVEVLDVDSRPDWCGHYGDRVPVVEIDGHFVCQYHLDREALAAWLPEPGQESRE